MTDPHHAETACEWRYDDDTDSWDTKCDNKHQFTADGPTENGYQFCPYCGKPLSEILFGDLHDEA